MATNTKKTLDAAKPGEDTEGKSNEVNGSTGNNSKSRGRRFRPPKSKRKPAEDGWMELQRNMDYLASNIPKGGNPKGTKQQRPSPKEPPLAPQPGKYPVLFDAEVGKPVHELCFSVAWDTNVNNHLSVLDSIRYAPGWNTYRAELAQGVTPAETRQFEGQFVAAGVLTTAQNVVRTVKENGRDIQGMSALDTTNIIHTSANRTVSSQYGLVKSSHTGEVYTPASVKQGSRKAVRASKFIVEHSISADADTTTEDICRSAASRAWLPTSQVDLDFEVSLRGFAQEWLDRRNYEYISVSKSLPLLNDQDPIWMPGIPEPQRPEIQWMFGARPATPAEWAARINAIPVGFYDHTSCPRPVDINGAPLILDPGDLDFELNERTELSRIADLWANKAVVLEKYFHTNGKAECTSQGSLAQTAQHGQDHGLIEYSNFTTNTANEASLAACFPPRVHMPYARREREATGVCQMNRDEVTAEWVMKAIK
jgi:hypothetical protein